MSVRPDRPTRGRRAASAALTVVIVVVIVALWPARLGGAVRWVIVSGTSMEPTHHLGDLVLVRSTTDAGVGDVVVFAVPSGIGRGELVIHRIVGVRADGAFVTQGDNRDTVDDWVVGPDDVVGRPVFGIPRLGGALAGLGGGTLLAPLVGLSATLALWPRRHGRGRDVHHDRDHDERHDHQDDHQDDATSSVWVGHREVGPDDMAAAERWLDEELTRLRCEARPPLPVQPRPARCATPPR